MPPAGPWLLGLAVLCLVAQTTLLPMVAPGSAVWDPAHVHLTLNGVIPRHEHVYGGDSDAGRGCVVSSEAAAGDDQQDGTLACATSSEGTASAAPILPWSPASLHVGPQGLERAAPAAAPLAWASAVLDVATPPPRLRA